MKYRAFAEARQFAQGLELKSQSEWISYCRGKLSGLEVLPEDIPVNPRKIYAHSGWSGMGDWLGTGTISSQFKEQRAFHLAREFAQSLGLRNQEEWKKFCRGKLPEKGLLPDDITANPHQTYKGKGWLGYGDWLGTGNISPRKRLYKTFEEAREFVRAIGLKTQKEWKTLCKMKFSGKRLLPESIPLSPERVYKNKGWICCADWLGTRNVKTFQRRFRSFENARSFARSLSLANQAEWLSFIKGGMPEKGLLPEDIPVAPHHVYSEEGWISWSDFLGSESVLYLTNIKSLEEADIITYGVDIQDKVEWNMFCWANFRKQRVKR